MMRDRLTLEPEWMTGTGVSLNGVPTGGLLTVLVEDLPFTWDNGWVMATNEGDETVYVQFLENDTLANAASPTATRPPVVDWLLDDFRAVRVQSQNSDGAWACALIVMRPNTPEFPASDLDRYFGGVSPPGLPSTITATAPTSSTTGSQQVKRTVDAWMGGIWYDSGDAPTTGNGLENCSPVDDSTSAAPTEVSLPGSPDEWQISNNPPTGKAVTRTFSKSL